MWFTMTTLFDDSLFNAPDKGYTPNQFSDDAGSTKSGTHSMNPEDNEMSTSRSPWVSVEGRRNESLWEQSLSLSAWKKKRYNDWVSYSQIYESDRKILKWNVLIFLLIFHILLTVNRFWIKSLIRSFYQYYRLHNHTDVNYQVNI